MTDQERGLMIAKLHVILQSSLVEVRNLALTSAQAQIHDLADTVEFIPHLLLRWDDERAEVVRPSLLQYESKYPSSANRYVGILDMEEEEFNQMYRPEQYSWELDPPQENFFTGEVAS